jgi:LysM repeat protein
MDDWHSQAERTTPKLPLMTSITILDELSKSLRFGVIKNLQSVRYMLPFFLLVSVVLLGLYRFLESGVPTPLTCAENSSPYLVKSGDSCWAIAGDRGATVEDLVRFNNGLYCDLLRAGSEICVLDGK